METLNPLGHTLELTLELHWPNRTFTVYSCSVIRFLGMSSEHTNQNQDPILRSKNHISLKLNKLFLCKTPLVNKKAHYRLAENILQIAYLTKLCINNL
jgi:hypothetical protein